MTPSPVDPLAPYFSSIVAKGEFTEGGAPAVDLSVDITSDIHISIPIEVYGYGNRGAYITLLLNYADGIEDSSLYGIVGNNEPYPSFLTMADAIPDGDRYYVKFNVAFREDWNYEAGQVHRTTFTLGDYRLPIVFEIMPD